MINYNLPSEDLEFLKSIERNIMRDKDLSMINNVRSFYIDELNLTRNIIDRLECYIHSLEIGKLFWMAVSSVLALMIYYISTII